MGVLEILLAVSSLAITIAIFLHQNKLHKKTTVPNILPPVISFDRFKLQPNRKVYLFVAVEEWLLNEDKIIAMLNLPIWITNPHPYTIDRLNVIFRFDKGSFISLQKNIPYKTAGIVDLAGFKRTESEDDKSKYSTYTLEDLNPDATAIVLEQIRLFSSRGDLKIPLSFPDGSSGVYSYSYEIAFTFELLLTGKNLPLQTFPFVLNVVAGNKEKGLKKVTEHRNKILEAFGESKDAHHLYRLLDEDCFFLIPDFEELSPSLQIGKVDENSVFKVDMQHRRILK